MRHTYKHTYKYVIALSAILSLMGCKDQNPLLGDWSLVKTPELQVAAYKVAQISGNAEISFEEGRMVSGEQSMEVSYSVNGNEVTVHYSNGEANTYLVENGDHFVFEIPKAGTFKYVRVN